VGLLALLIAGSLAALAGAYAFTGLPLAAACLVVALICGVRIAASCETRRLDLALLALAGGCVVQLVPLPPAVVAIVSPHVDEFHARFHLPTGAPPTARTLSLDPAATAYSLALLVSFTLVFWTSRRLLERGGARRLARAVIWIGLAVSVIAILQRATSPWLIFWTWRPLDRGSEPFGPFVNRNHFASWIVMALPLCAGYLVSVLEETAASLRLKAWVSRAVRWLAGGELWLFASGTMMVAALTLARSRSGLVSAASALAGAAVLTRSRLPRWSGPGLLAYAFLLLLVVFSWSDVPALMGRFDETLRGSDGAGRLVIWRESLELARRFWIAGLGAGAYETAMIVYQQSYRNVAFFNQAHNHYLQLVAEGGLLLTVPALVAASALAGSIARRLRESEGSIFWIRCGAATGLAGIAIQSIWETGLRMPANAVLFAVLCALAVHATPPHPPSNAHRPRTSRS
jgi:O-antigen ligase